MKVLLVTPDLRKPGGVAHYYGTLQSHLTNDVEYFTVGARQGDRGTAARLLRTVRDSVRFHRRVKSREFDLVHLNPSLTWACVIRDGLLLLIAKLYWAKVLVFFRGWDVRCERAIRRRFSRLFRCIYSKADAFIVLASRFRLVLEDLGCAGRVYVETTVVPDDVFARGVRKTRERVSAGGALNILFLSRVEKLKGVYIAIEAFRILKHKHPSATLTIAGDGPDLQGVKEFVASQQIPGVEFPGWLASEAKREAFSNAHLYLFPTLWGEGMPNSVLEAMAYGLPVVTRPVGGLRDFFQDGRMGFVIESDDPKDFGEALHALAEDATLRDSIGIYNREYALHNFRASHVARRLERIYASMVAL